jgi:diguanylate cyclase (GGDEF)-like protein
MASLARTIRAALPTAVVVGCVSNGEIIDGRPEQGKTLVSISAFSATQVLAFSCACQAGREREMGNNLLKSVSAERSLHGVLLLCNPRYLDTALMVDAFRNLDPAVQVFGGVAGHFYEENRSWLIDGEKILSEGMIAVGFYGDDLIIQAKPCVGWKALSREMIATEATGTLLKKIDGEPAFSVYHKYLGIQRGQDFFDNSLGFGLMLQREGTPVVRIPFKYTEDDGLRIFAEVLPGERLRLGYADPIRILDKVREFVADFARMSPEAILLFSCGSRIRIMGADESLETEPFGKLAPCQGFYTAGEFCRNGGELVLLNSSMVVVGLREGPPSKAAPEGTFPIPPVSELRDTRGLGYLIHFIGKITAELDEANRELERQATHDKLTRIYNRTKLDQVISAELARARRCGGGFSIVIIDIDYFKQVNDTRGHLAGDIVLSEFADRLKSVFERDTDSVGRWGGEEFLCVLLDADPEKVWGMAERFRLAVNSASFSEGDRLTCSLGITSYKDGDTETGIVARADRALYEAKRAGRDRTVQA